MFKFGQRVKVFAKPFYGKRGTSKGVWTNFLGARRVNVMFDNITGSYAFRLDQVELIDDKPLPLPG